MQTASNIRSNKTVPHLPGVRGEFKLADLVPSAHNVRKCKRASDDIRAMAQSIHSHGGVMQNLLLVADIDKAGAWTGKYGVVGGETRRLGCCYLRDGGIPEAKGIYTDTFLVPGLVVDAPEASAMSATENIRRTQLHPADEFEAFRELFDQCGSSEHVADFFAVSPATVERRLKLANASPKLFELFRNGGMNLDQLMALCLVDDHQRQEAVWKAGERHTYMRGASQLRQALTSGKVNIRESRIARFVGAAEFEAAGGQIVRDLFSAHPDDGYIEDGELLQRLAAEKLQGVAEIVRAEGWTWVEVKSEFRYEEQAKYGRCPVRKRALNPTETKQLANLRAQADVARKAWEQADEADSEPMKVAELEEVSDRLDAEVIALEDAGKAVPAAFQAIAGAVVSIDHAGRCEVFRGFVRPEDRKELKRAQKAAESSIPGAATGAASGARVSADTPATDDVPRPFKLRLGAQRTAAMQIALGRNVPLALASLAFSLVSDVLLQDRTSNPLRVSSKSARERLTSLDPSIEASRAFVEMGELIAVWKARLPDDDVFAWVCALPQDELLQLIALCTALSLDSVGDNVFQASPLDGHAADIADRAALDMADWWSPSAATYFAHVSKAHTLAVVAQVISAEAAAPLAGLKKAGLGAQAEKLLEGKRWLPTLLHRPS